MQFFKLHTLIPNRLTTALLAGAVGIFAANLNVAAQDAQPQPTAGQRQFDSPDDAIKALQQAAQAKDSAALTDIFGPDFHNLQTGDQVQDANHEQHFAATMAEGCNPVKEGDDRIVLEIGTNSWPMPIPLVKTDGKWHFDTAAGKEEIVNRHIGEDELCAVGVCRAYVKAQQQYAAMNVGGQSQFAQKFKSEPGKKDGLYWPASANEQQSPLGPLVAEAHAEGYTPHPSGTGPHPFHGYYFRILTRQGPAADGGRKNYVSHGELKDGFALVAYPEHWDQSGIMTFIVNQDGKVFERNLAEKTSRIASSMKEFNPDSKWTPVEDQGVADAAFEK